MMHGLNRAFLLKKQNNVLSFKEKVIPLQADYYQNVFKLLVLSMLFWSMCPTGSINAGTFLVLIKKVLASGYFKF